MWPSSHMQVALNMLVSVMLRCILHRYACRDQSGIAALPESKQEAREKVYQVGHFPGHQICNCMSFKSPVE